MTSKTYKTKQNSIYVYHHIQSIINNNYYNEDNIKYINTTIMSIQFIKDFLFAFILNEDQQKINDSETKYRNLITHVIKIQDSSLPKNRYCELLLVEINNELIPIFKSNINYSSYYSLCRMNHTYCMEEDIIFTNAEILKMCNNKYHNYLTQILQIKN